MENPVIIGDAILYHGDAMEILPELKEKANLLLFDPPYKLTSGGEGSRCGEWTLAKGYNNDGNIVLCDIDWSDFIPLAYDALKDGHAYIMANNRHVQNLLNSAEDAGFKFHNLLIWDKCSATPNRWYMKNLEFIGFFYKGKAKEIKDCGSKQLIKCPQVDVSDHPTEKPVALMQHYIENSTEKNEIVLDPFMGSGTTGVAAIKSGRKFIGIEKDKKWFDVACERISSAKRQETLL